MDNRLTQKQQALLDLAKEQGSISPNDVYKIFNSPLSAEIALKKLFMFGYLMKDQERLGYIFIKETAEENEISRKQE